MSETTAPPVGIESKVVQMNYTGGIVGVFSNRRTRLERTLQKHNDEGWTLRHVLPSKSGIFSLLVSLICLAITLLLWAPEPGETLVFERRH